MKKGFYLPTGWRGERGQVARWRGADNMHL